MIKRVYSKYLAGVFVLLCCVSTVKAQFEIGILAGGSYYYGDVVNEWEPSTIRGAGGAFIRYHVNDRIKIKGFAGMARIMGADSLSSSEFQQVRNSDFFSDVIEGSVHLEYCLVDDNMRGRRIRNRLIPYIFAGLGAFWFSPKSLIPDPLTGAPVETNLASFQTNGFKYDQIAICVPFGAGIKYKITHNFSLGLELGIRYTLTSYLDDIDGNNTFFPANQYAYPGATILVADRSKLPRNDDGSTSFSQPGNLRGKLGDTKDMYLMYGLTLGYRFGKSSGGGGYSGKAIRCPRFY